MRIKIPWLSFSALIFCLIFLFLTFLNLIPSSEQLLLSLKIIYGNYWVWGLFLATLIEGIVYIGLYFPGSTIIALSVVLSRGDYFSLFLISLIVAITLTFTSLINYFLGFILSKRKKGKLLDYNSSFLFSCLYPDALAFYFFNEGVNRKGLFNVLLVPLVLFPYGLLLALIISLFRPVLEGLAENPFFMTIIISIWFIIAFYLKNKKES